ncbi:tyrosine-type recombinase/integrase [Ureibacillus endophyticus]|nr:site-specific integrase [Lysinibacillus endophyticus]
MAHFFSCEVAHNSIAKYKSIESKFNKHILPRFGQLKIRDITKTYCQKVINEIAESIKSVNDIKIQANQVFKYALKMDIIQKNPLEHISIPRQQNELINDDNEADARNYWRKDEIKKFLEITKLELSYRDYVLFHLLIYTGARKGEILALTWDDIDFKSKSIRFSKTLFHNKGEFIFQTSKTKESRRLISLDDKTLSILKKWRVRQKNLVLLSTEDDALKKQELIENNQTFESKEVQEDTEIPRNLNLIFSREDGTPIRLAYPNEKLDIVIKKHNLHRITIHGLRHTHASLLFEAGASIKEVQERLGHSDIQMTMNIYTHVTDTLKEQTAHKFQRYIEL